MRNIITFSVLFAVAFVQPSNSQSLSTFINEINYLASNPTEAGLEIAGEAGTDLAGWTVVGYALDGTVEFVEYIEAGLIPNQQNGYGTFWYDVEQTGNGGGLALVNAGGNVVQFISYGTINFSNVVITATEGAANGLTSEYVGTQLIPENSLQLSGTGQSYLSFLWSLPSGATQGQINTNQLFQIPLLIAGSSDNGLQNSDLNDFSADNQDFTDKENSFVELAVFPNPTVDLLQIRTDGQHSGPVDIHLFDGNGKLVLSSQARTGAIEFDLMHLAPGHYFLHLEIAGQRFVEKIIKM